MDAVRRQIELERLVNLLSGFGWEKMSEKVDGNTLEVTVKKVVEEEPPPTD